MRSVVSVGVAIVIMASAGCNQAKSPEEVAKDVANAQQQATADVDKSEDRAAQDLDKAAAKVDDKLITFNDDATRDAYDVDVTKAYGDRRVALAKCTSLQGDAQKECKDQAEADFNTTKARLKTAAESPKQ